MREESEILKLPAPDTEPLAPPRAQSQRPLSETEAAMLVQQISGLSNAGLTLPGGLRAMADEIDSGPLPAVLRDLALRVEQGEELGSALESQGGRLPKHLHGLIRAGMESGRLADVLSQYVHHCRMAQKLRRRIASGMIYPTILLTVFVAVSSFMLIGIVPKFKVLFMDFGQALPAITLALFYMSDWVVASAFPAFLLLGIFAIGGWLLCVLLLSPAQRQRLLHRVPILGSFWRSITLAEFARLLALLVERELPLPQCLRLAASGLSDADLADIASTIASELERGQSLTESPTRRARLPGVLAQSLQWGNDSQTLAESLQTAAEMIESQARVRAEFITRAAPPITMILIVVFLGFIVTALFVPMTKMIGALSG